jgi:hypothetical protein
MVVRDVTFVVGTMLVLVIRDDVVFEVVAKVVFAVTLIGVVVEKLDVVVELVLVIVRDVKFVVLTMLVLVLFFSASSFGPNVVVFEVDGAE